MVISCAAVNCTNRQGKVDKTEVSFHRFPIHNPRRLAKWERAVRRESWVPNKYSFLCSKHFTPDCFLLRCDDQHRQLKASAVPTVFDFTPQDRSAGGNLRKKVLSTKVLEGEEDKEEQEEEEEKVVVLNRGPVRDMSMSTNQDEGGTEPRGSGPIPEVMGNLPLRTAAQQVAGEWAQDEGNEEAFTPSSRALIDALHSYSSCSRQERQVWVGGRQALGGVAAVKTDSCRPLKSELSRGSHTKAKCKHGHYRLSQSLAQRLQLQRRARCLRSAVRFKRFRTHVGAAQGEMGRSGRTEKSDGMSLTH